MKKIIGLFFLICLQANAQTKIEIFADGPVALARVADTNVTVFDLSLPARLDESAPDFPADPALAEIQAKAWLASPAGKQHIANLKEAYRGQQQLMAYDIRKVPAIVFESGRYVIYGTLDLAVAVRDYDNYRRAHSELKQGGRDEAAH